MKSAEDLLHSWFVRQYIRFTGWDRATGEPRFALTAYGRAKLWGRKPQFKSPRLVHSFQKEAEMQEYL